MKFNFQDPTVLIPAGIICLGLFLLFWAVGKLFKKNSTVNSLGMPITPGDDLLIPPLETTPLPSSDFSAPSPSDFKTPVSSRETVAPAGASREISERLENMTQKLTDMQSVLQRQATTAAPGTPLSPETIDKLLKIIGNVTQQVDILQKSLGAAPVTSVAPVTPVTRLPPSAHAPTPAPSPAPAPAPAPSPAPAPAPASAPAQSTPPASATNLPPGGRVGVLGGALSSFKKAGQTPPPAGSTPPPASPPPEK